MRGVVAIICACIVGACGRLDFDPVAARDDAASMIDAVPGHDEDQDGFADSIDPCPHVAGDLLDQDGDGVGDDCDPNPNNAGERYVVFSPLTPGNHPFVEIAGWTQEPDGLRYVGAGETFGIVGTFTTFRLEVGFNILALFGTTQHQVASGVEGLDPYYFVELNDNQGTNNAAVVAFDQANGYVTLAMAPHSGVHPGRGLLRYDAIATDPPEFRLLTGWIGEMYQANAPTPGYAGGSALRLVFNGLDVVVEYVVIIETR